MGGSSAGGGRRVKLRLGCHGAGKGLSDDGLAASRSPHSGTPEWGELGERAPESQCGGASGLRRALSNPWSQW